MIRIIGACLIVIATTWVGFQKAKRYADRPRQIRQLRSSLSLLKTEIGYGTRPLVQACGLIAMRMQSPISILFRAYEYNLNNLDGSSTYDCLKKAVEQEWDKTALTENERGIILDFGKTLGISDREDQLQHLALADANLCIEETKAREEQMQYEKMYKTMGILCGVLIVILIF